jgi:hypothetical protein
VTADAVREDEQPAVRAHLRERRGGGISKEVFVVVADSPDVGAVREF